MSALKPWHTLILGVVIGLVIAKKTSVKIPFLG